MKSWSFSKLKAYERCPHTQSFPYEWKPSGEAAQAGLDAHKQCEDWIVKGEVIPTFEKFDWTKLRAINPFTEVKIGVDENWKRTEYKEAWLKIIIDALYPDFNTLIDYKSGKQEYNEVSHIQQMQLYACVINAIYAPDFVQSELWYLNEGHIRKTIYTPKKCELLQVKFHDRALKMLKDETLLPKPSKSNCRFCPHQEVCTYTYED
jgi:CRISPR/Cas system-associated exonuclease Cas4 (RecB family)